jgi:hypothetical protein
VADAPQPSADEPAVLPAWLRLFPVRRGARDASSQ